MESIQTNHPVLARALEFSQEAARQRQLAQEAAAKIENPLKEQPASRVTFSQEAQTRLNEEKTHGANLVKEVRDAERAAVAEARSQTRREEYLSEVEARVEARDLRAERDHLARDKAVVAEMVLAAKLEAVEKTAKATRADNAVATESAFEQQSLKAAEFVERAKADDLQRSVDAKTKETGDLQKREELAAVVKNLQAGKEDVAVAVEQTQKVKKLNEQVKAETAKAMKMYRHIDSMA